MGGERSNAVSVFFKAVWHKDQLRRGALARPGLRKAYMGVFTSRGVRRKGNMLRLPPDNVKPDQRKIAVWRVLPNGALLKARFHGFFVRLSNRRKAHEGLLRS